MDRDGVINKDSSEYIKDESEFEFIPKSPEAIALLTKKDFQVIVITNQSLIGRKMASQKTVDAVFKKMKEGVRNDLKIFFGEKGYCLWAFWNKFKL